MGHLLSNPLFVDFKMNSEILIWDRRYSFWIVFEKVAEEVSFPLSLAQDIVHSPM